MSNTVKFYADSSVIKTVELPQQLVDLLKAGETADELVAEVVGKHLLTVTEEQREALRDEVYSEFGYSVMVDDQAEKIAARTSDMKWHLEYCIRYAVQDYIDGVDNLVVA